MKKLILYLLLIPLQAASLLPMLLYPFVALASLMGLAGHRTGNEPLGQLLLAYTFYILTLAYPVPSIGGAVLCWRYARKGNAPRALLFALIPIIFLAVVGLLFLTVDK